ncbi:MAG: hypothetical protein H6830_02115 [Planctomycetes bacterium]|nr:hypothetical protein [Planctomycetota bacterium]MCB9910623.1 hypothetical protein [Planctomycetota bacterium]
MSLALPLLLAAGCRPQGPAKPGEPVSDQGPAASQAGERPRDANGIPIDAPVGPEARAQIAELMEAFRPIDPTLTSDHFDRQIFEQREIFQRLAQGGPEIGHAALHAYTGAKDEPYLVRRALLWVGGKASPKEAEPLLATLVDQYGITIEDRTEALLVLAEVAPDKYFEIVRPYLERRERLKKTMPDDEFLVEGWVNASIAKGVSPVPMLADVATNLLMMPNSRYRAAKRMREFPNEIVGQRALETCLIESTGDNYLRIMAAQSLVKLLPRETACTLFEETLAREASVQMAHFLTNMIQENCR